MSGRSNELCNRGVRPERGLLHACRREAIRLEACGPCSAWIGTFMDGEIRSRRNPADESRSAHPGKTCTVSSAARSWAAVSSAPFHPHRFIARFIRAFHPHRVTRNRLIRNRLNCTCGIGASHVRMPRDSAWIVVRNSRTPMTRIPDGGDCRTRFARRAQDSIVATLDKVDRGNLPCGTTVLDLCARAPDLLGLRPP